jgi:1,4-alpha-glucan branching enzyme
MKGYHALVLHAHLPFVRHPEYEQFLEEDWLYEAITETYVPLLERFERLVDDGVRLRVTMTMTPPLVSMLRDELLVSRYGRELDKLCELAGKEVARTAKDATYGPLARYYLDHFTRTRSLFHDRYKRDLVGAFARLQDAGALEIITCGATHGFLPLLREQPESVRAQVKVAAASYERHFGRRARGIWLPECGYYPGVEQVLADEGLRFFFVDTHAILDATPRPRYGAYAPLYTASGVAAFGRDQASSVQVWSAERGYPGDPAYREFYRDIGFDLDFDYVKPYVQPTGDRKNTGIKYHRITGKVPLSEKAPYDPRAAQERARVHAGNFVFNRARQVEELAGALGRPPVVVSPYDAELYGHWWYEGPDFLEAYFRQAAAQDVYEVTTPLEYLQQHPRQQVATPPVSSWGAGGYAAVWLDPVNDWIYRHLHKAAERMVALARDYPAPDALTLRALNQAGRELLLAQSSDWAFIMKMGTMVEYAVRRTKEHVGNFTRLHEEIRAGRVDAGHLAFLEGRHNLFPELDYRAWSPVER